MRLNKEKAQKIIDDRLAKRSEILELEENFQTFLAENSSDIVQKVISEENERDNAIEETATQGTGSEISLARRIEELARGLISTVAGTFAELQSQSMQTAPATGFRRSQLRSEKEPESADVESPNLPEVVNWVPTDISSAIVGCSVFLAWKGRGVPSASLALTVIYDEEVVSFDTKPEGARGIEISIMQDTPARFMIEITEAGEYVVNLYSS